MRRFFQVIRLALGRSLFEGALWWLSLYAIPLAILIASLASLFLWNDLYSSNPENNLDLHVIQSNDVNSPSDAREKLGQVPLKRHYDTKLSETPVWLSFKTPASTVSEQMVEFPSRHAVELACWDAVSLHLLGNIKTRGHNGALLAVKAGFALTLEHPEQEVICRTSFVGPARLSADLWSSDQLDVSIQDFHRKSGWLDGGMFVLALFVLITALINRQSLYVLFAVWLILTLRISATSGGWDTQWLNHEVPAEWLAQGRSVTRAAYALLTLTLFKTLFRDDLAQTRFNIPIRVASWLCMILLVASFFLPRHVFLPTMWVVGGGGLLILSISLVSIVARTRSRVALWYAASLAVTFLSGISEIVAAAYGLKEAGGTAISVISVLASSLLAALAIAQQMRQEHNQRLEAQAELQHTYEAMPIGLFTLDLRGRFIRANPAVTDRHIGSIP